MEPARAKFSANRRSALCSTHAGYGAHFVVTEFSSRHVSYMLSGAWEVEMVDRRRARNPLTPWWIGLAINIVAVIYAAYRFSRLECGPPSIFAGDNSGCDASRLSCAHV